MKIFVSSRDDRDIVFHLREYPNLELSSDRNSDDIASFVRAKTLDLIRKRKLLHLSMNKEELSVVIAERVTKDANGMWVLPRIVSTGNLSTNVIILGSAGLAYSCKAFAM